MKVAIVQFPGSNCERETMLAVQRAGMTPVEFLWNEPAASLQAMDAFIIVGGFSYEDRSRAGIIAALDPIMQGIKQQAELGKPVLGICNGAQILVETGLVPGLNGNQLGMALTENKRIKDGKILGTGFYNTWINIKPCANAQPNAFTKHLTKDSVLTIPLAHAEGRFVMHEALLDELMQQGLGIFQYCDEHGAIDANFPVNPNGSMNNIAAVINKAGNVMAIMPHPERTKAGDAIFASMRDYIAASTKPMDPADKPRDVGQKQHTTPMFSGVSAESTELIVQLIITDNTALTVQNTLKQLGINVSVTRLVHWQIDSQDRELIEKIKHSGVLFNDRKEFLVAKQELQHKNSRAFLVRTQDDVIGQQKLQMLRDHFALTDLTRLHHGIIWIFSGESDTIQSAVTAVLDTHIIANPYAHKVYEYE